jgi:class 3 adenylate cyclase/tetratricopeptide (TPR) repeat protein
MSLPMSDVTRWLESLGLGRYGDAFEENDIETELLKDLTDEFLQAVGVTSVGHRMKILKAVREGAPPGQPTSVEAPDKPIVPFEPSGEAERRQLTVMFCDLVGSVELGERMDLEDYRDLLARFRNAAVDAVERYGGFVARHQGDGVLVYFGYPQGHEDDAERAVRAGLDIVRAIKTAEPGINAGLEVRIGIATGSVVVGDILDAGRSREFAALGSSPNLAARLQGKAQPNSVLISETTYRLVRGRFKTDATPSLSLKGIETPIVAYYVKGESQARTRLDATDYGHLSPMVGRGAEIVLLLDRWSKAESGSGQVVFISAEPGVGKSRLIREIETGAAARGALRVQLQCSPYHTGSAFYPVLESIGRGARLFDYADDSRRLDCLESWLGSIGMRVGEIIPLLAPLLAIPMERRYAEVDISAEERRKRILDALAEIVSRLSEQQAVLLVVEDLHWVDPSTEELLGRLIEGSRNQRVLVTVTFRPEYRPVWKAEPHITALTLNHLTATECRTLVAEVARDSALSLDLVDQIVERADGVPLYAEELVRALTESGAESDSAIPATLRDALTARLDNLGEAKEIAQIASVVGRSFSPLLVGAVSGISGGALNDSLERLLSSGLAYRRHTPRGENFEFKHALVRDTAYESLLRPRRRALHAAVFAAMQADVDDRADEYANELGGHAFRGELWQEAAHYLRRAGQRAIRSSAFREAQSRLEQALRAAERMEPGEIRTRDAINLHVELRHAQGALADYSAVRETLGEAVDLAAEIDDQPLLASLNADLTHVLFHLGELQQAVLVGEQAVAAACRAHDRPAEVHARSNLAMAHFWRGEFNQAIDLATSVRADLEGRFRHARLGGTPWRSACLWLGNLSGMHAMRGEFSVGNAIGREAMAIGEEEGNIFDRVAGRSWLSFCLMRQGQVKEALRIIEPVAGFAEEAGSDFALSWTRYTLGHALMLDGQLNEAIGHLEASLGESDANTTRAMRNFSLTFLAWALLEAGELDRCVHLLEPWLLESRSAGFLNLVPMALRVLGQASARANEPDLNRAASLIDESMELARQQGARPDLAHGLAASAEVLEAAGRVAEAGKCRTEAGREYEEMGMDYWTERARLSGR